MKKEIIYREESPNLKKVMEDFCRAKQIIYQYSPEEYEKKVENFYKNVQSIQFSQPTLISTIMHQGGGFVRRKGNIVLRVKDSVFKGEHRLDSNIMQILIHELNHAWNYVKGERIGIIPKPFNKSNIAKYLFIMEAINEAETQLLCSKDLKIDDKSYTPDEKEFLGYGTEESSIFQTLCTVCNQKGIDFLKNIEGMTIEGIISHISNRTGHSIEDSKEFFEKFAELSVNNRKEKGKISSKIAKGQLKQAKEMFKNNVNDVEIDSIMEETLSTIQVPSRISRDL